VKYCSREGRLDCGPAVLDVWGQSYVLGVTVGIVGMCSVCVTVVIVFCMAIYSVIC